MIKVCLYFKGGIEWGKKIYVSFVCYVFFNVMYVI